MLKKTITSTDFNGNKETEDFLFNLTEAEIVELQFSEAGGFEQTIKRLIETNDNKEIIRIVKSVILKAYGVKSEDGKRFIKSEALSTEFSQTQAFSDLFMELVSDDKAAADFMNALVPKKISDNK